MTNINNLVCDTCGASLFGGDVERHKSWHIQLNELIQGYIADSYVITNSVNHMQSDIKQIGSVTVNQEKLIRRTISNVMALQDRIQEILD